uniref:Coatomer subunit epsilon n=1 Tax=Steinernema glaseri TaxID=37863 RepID=A0A1I7Y1M5_9BILA
MADTLFEVRNAFYLGAYQQCVHECHNAHVKGEEEKLAKDCFMYRSYIALGKPSIALSEIPASTQVDSLAAIRRFADYSANAEKRRQIAEEVGAELTTNMPDDEVAHLMAALIFLSENDIENALRVLHMSESLECTATSIQCLLKLDRADLATKELKKMQEVDEDSTLTQLALAWCNMYFGKEKLKDAFYIYQEMIDKYGPNPSLLVSQASCLIQQEKYEEAQKLLLDAQQRDAHNAEVLINLVVVSQFLGKPAEVTTRYIKQLTTEFPHHSWSLDYCAKEKAFAHLALESSA